MIILKEWDQDHLLNTKDSPGPGLEWDKWGIHLFWVQNLK